MLQGISRYGGGIVKLKKVDGGMVNEYINYD
jgi:hypothetical protein